MSNPYASTAGAGTITATVLGDGSLGGTPTSGGSPDGSQGPVRSMPPIEVLRRLGAYVRPHAALAAAALLCTVGSVILQLRAPLLIGRGIDLIAGAGQVDSASLCPLLSRLVAVVAAAALLQWAQGACVARLSRTVARDLRVDLHAKLTRIPLSLIDGHPHGDYISRVVNDVDQVGDGLVQSSTQLLNAMVSVVATLGFMLMASPPMALIVVLLTPVSMFAAGTMARLSGESFALQMDIQGRVSAYIEEYVGAQRLVSAFAYGERAQEGFEAVNEELRGAGERAQFLSSLANPGTRLVNNCIYAIVAAVGFIGVVTGFPATLSVGDVQVFLSYASQYTKPFNEVSGVAAQIQGALASARRAFALLDAESEAADAPDAIELHRDAPGEAARRFASVRADAPISRAAPMGDIEFDHVYFSYRSSQPLIRDVSLHARPGMRMALVGPTGCGKTTLINLLARFYDVDSGEIRLDGRPIGTYARADLRRSFGMVLQEDWLFEGTVHDNIAYSRALATRAQVEEAAHRARADAFIRALPAGYDTVLSEGGGVLSQGQRQLLCIARVMLADPAILLLDEATSTIDTRTELQVQAAFDELMQGRTSLVVAHRLSTIQNADCILVMREGRIVERGVHEELLAAQGLYAELHDSQFFGAGEGLSTRSRP